MSRARRHQGNPGPDPGAADLDPGRLGAELSDAIVLFHEAIGAVSGLSAADHKAYGIVARHGPLTATELARRTGLTPGAITGLVDRLDRAGLVRRDRDPADRRRVVIIAVPRSNPRAAAAFRSLSRSMAEVAERYPPDQLAAITDWIKRTAAVLRQETRALTGEDDGA